MTDTTIEITHELATRGYALTPGPLTPDEAVDLASRLGTLIPQTTGELAYEIVALPGFGKSLDTHCPHILRPQTLRPHTEAPGLNPPPRYLAVHCRVQATCGGGRTMLADAHAFVAGLSRLAQRMVHERDMHWPSYAEDIEVTGAWKPVVEQTERGTITRMSCTLLRTGYYSEGLDAWTARVNPPLGTDGVALAQQVLDFFQDNHVSILIPEGAMVIWDNQRMFHARSAFTDTRRRLTRYWITD
ncbi:TauD/TfdA family dioxygenase [Nocardia sp. NPDC051570]|uniref:TauD/TfdA family dioxygenase n=1 Tax=Nocardia sp. NPDC051570 TaxID=3364324 RepID=UPI0037A5BA81